MKLIGLLLNLAAITENMTDLLKFVTIWTFLAVKCCQCTRTTILPEITDNSTTIDTKSDYLFSPHFGKIIKGIYKENFENFNKVLHFAEISNDLIFKADTLLELYNGMNEVKHTKNPIKALYLYREIETIINLNSDNLNAEKLEKLQTIRQDLLREVIVPKGAQILENAVYLNESIQNETVVGKFMELMHLNETLSNLTMKLTLQNLHWMPFGELLPILTNLSSCADQNVASLLLLNDEYHLQKTQQDDLIDHLLLLRKQSSHKFAATTKRKIDAFIPPGIRKQNDGVCLYQQLWDGSRIYAKCSDSDLRGFECDNSEKPLASNFYLFDMKHKGSDQLNDYYPYRLSSATDKRGNEWTAIYEGEQVSFQEKRNKRYICTSRSGSVYLQYGKDNYCNWLVDYCYLL